MLRAYFGPCTRSPAILHLLSNLDKCATTCVYNQSRRSAATGLIAIAPSTGHLHLTDRGLTLLGSKRDSLEAPTRAMDFFAQATMLFTDQRTTFAIAKSR